MSIQLFVHLPAETTYTMPQTKHKPAHRLAQLGQFIAQLKSPTAGGSLSLGDSLRRYPSFVILLCIITGYLCPSLGTHTSLSIGLGMGLPMLLLGVLTPQGIELHRWIALRRLTFSLGLGLCLISLASYRQHLPDLGIPQSLSQWAEDGRAYLIAQAEATGISIPALRLSSAIALGYSPRGDVAMVELKEAFRLSGVAHVLVLSGMHVSLVVATIAALLRLLPPLRRRWRTKTCLTIALTAVFVLLTGAGIPALRAWLCLTLYLVGHMLGRRSLSLGLLYSSAVVQLLLCPSVLHSWSFLLTYTAVLSIHLFRYPLTRLIPTPQMPLLTFLHTQLILMLSAQVLTLPLCLWLFGSVSWAFLFCSLPLVLVCMLYVPLCLIFYLSLGVGLNLAPLSYGVEQCSGLMHQLSLWGANLPYMQMQVAPPVWSYLLYLILMIAIALRWQEPAEGEPLDWERFYRYY